ncbi:MAG TPA: hypothetical protein VMT73_07855 [Anaerolineales bacterium]|nr:hypothetical protein [Anaerolineales bacterium]
MKEEQTQNKIESLLQPSKEKLILVIAILGMWAILGLLFIFYGYIPTWRLWRIPALSPFFFDFRLIPGMVQTLRMGLDPTVTNPGDPIGRIFNYPRIWYLLAYTNLSQSDTLWVGILLIILFFVAVMLFPGKLKKLDILLMMLVLFSPAAMLLYERANVDLFIFFLCALAVAVSEAAVITSVVIVLFAAVLKLFPFFGMGMFLFKEKRVFLWLLIPSTIVFIFYLLVTSHNVQASWSLTQRGNDISYGANVVVAHFKHDIRFISKQWITDKASIPTIFSNISYAAALLIALVSLWIGLQARQRLTTLSQRNLNAFWMGGAIYVGTFLLGNNWDYRLAFLVLIVPQVSEWIHQSTGRQRGAMILTMSLIVVSCWYMMYSSFVTEAYRDYSFIFDELVDWSLFAALAYLLAASVPEWFRPLFTTRPKFLVRNSS